MYKSNGRSNDDRKVIVRQLDFNTEEATIEQYFSEFGQVEQMIMKYNENGRSKGFCFVVFNDKATLEEVLKTEHHEIDGKAVQVRRAGETAGNNQTTKLFCGGLPHALSEDDLQEYFIQFGEIGSFEFIYDKSTQVRKHFCFIVFQDAASVDKIVEGKVPPGSVVHHIGKYRVECKKKFDDNHPIQKKVKRESNMKKDSWDEGYGGYGGGGYSAPPRRAAPSRRPAPRGRGRARARPRASSYSAYPGYSSGSYTDPYAEYTGYEEESYAAPADPYAEEDPYAGYTATESEGYSDQSAVSGYSSYPGYESEGGPMKARGGARGAARGRSRGGARGGSRSRSRGGAYRPY